MTHFILTFKIAADDDYERRYTSLVDAVYALTNGRVWDETTSFYAFIAEGSAEYVAATLSFESLFNPEKDILIVFDIDQRVRAAVGKLDHPSQLRHYVGF